MEDLSPNDSDNRLVFQQPKKEEIKIKRESRRSQPISYCTMYATGQRN